LNAVAGRGKRAWRAFLKEVDREGSFPKWYARRREEETAKRANLVADARAAKRANLEAYYRAVGETAPDPDEPDEDSGPLGIVPGVIFGVIVAALLVILLAALKWALTYLFG
jgi:hypothetical protein